MRHRILAAADAPLMSSRLRVPIRQRRQFVTFEGFSALKSNLRRSASLS